MFADYTAVDIPCGISVCEFTEAADSWRVRPCVAFPITLLLFLHRTHSDLIWPQRRLKITEKDSKHNIKHHLFSSVLVIISDILVTPQILKKTSALGVYLSTHYN